MGFCTELVKSSQTQEEKVKSPKTGFIQLLMAQLVIQVYIDAHDVNGKVAKRKIFHIPLQNIFELD